MEYLSSKKNREKMGEIAAAETTYGPMFLVVVDVVSDDVLVVFV